MLGFVSATRYDKRMKNGKTKPCLMAAERSALRDNLEAAITEVIRVLS